jgi:hypothetical protein
MRKLEIERSELYYALPDEVHRKLKNLVELEDQIDALPFTSALREEKVRQFQIMKSDLLSNERWKLYLTSYTLAIESMQRRIHEVCESYAKEKRLPRIYFANQPCIDETTGHLKFVNSPILQTAIADCNALDITPEIVLLLRRGEVQGK